MDIFDLLLTGGVVAVALWYLYRKLVRQKGCSCGSGGCGARTCGKE